MYTAVIFLKLLKIWSNKGMCMWICGKTCVRDYGEL